MKTLHLFLKDLKLAFRSFYVYIEFITALVFIVVILFLLPENFESTGTIYVSADLEGAALERLTEQLDVGESENTVNLLESRDAVERALNEDRNALGLFVTLEEDVMVYEFILQGYETPEMLNLFQHLFLAETAAEQPGYVPVTTVETLVGTRESLSDRIMTLPVFLVLNSSFIGLFIVASYIFMDKDEGTIRALAVTTARVSDYLLSKMGLMLVIGLVTALLTTFAIAGTSVHYVHLFVFLAVANLFGTALGLFITSFFDTIINAMGVIIVTVLTMAFTTIPYYFPAYNPLMLRVIPTYPMLISIRELMYAEPNLGYVYASAAGITALTVILFLAANYRFKRTLTI